SGLITSTKSEKLYPSMLHRNTEQEAEPYYCLPIGSLSHWSQPTSPAPTNARTFPLSPTHSGTSRHNIPKNDELHGSSISLVSTASSLYSSAEEKQAHEIRKLRRELSEAQEKVHTLTSQLSTNAPKACREKDKDLEKRHHSVTVHCPSLGQSRLAVCPRTPKKYSSDD
ncbi:hypothetical protein GWI33_014665, partial [Rhynchophorus ferrugineus]